MAPSGLTPKRERFCWLYVEKSSASEAYRLSHDVAPDTKPETIHRNAHALLQDTKVTARIEEIRAELRERNAITLDNLVERLRPIIDADIRKVVDWGDAVAVKDAETGEITIAQGFAVKCRADLEDAAALTIAEISQTKDGAVRVRLHDKLAAIEKVAKLLGLVKEHHDVKVTDITPRPTLPSREAMDEDLRKFRQAVTDYYRRTAAEAEAEAGAADAKPNGSRMH